MKIDKAAVADEIPVEVFKIEGPKEAKWLIKNRITRLEEQKKVPIDW